MSSPGFVDSAWNSAEDVLDDILKHAEYCADWPDYKSAPMPASLVSYYDGANAGSSSSSGAATYQKEKDCSESEKCDKGKEWFSENGGNGSGGTSGVQSSSKANAGG
ncbi:uncharacterized protein LOC135141589 isoform X2 [Zophobas morio]|uniref:uncharacterized protein LOC135141589 isoform X2 n=1 Tax=Zophobas morio TaxID=2755281 RepID=UPI003082703B